MESAFAATLPPRERRLAGRLEGFGDIVFGFAVSQCALQLPLNHGGIDLRDFTSLGIYFLTFALLARLWLSFHELMSGSFKPTSIDLILAFVFLAFVTLMPYALYAISHHFDSFTDARVAVGQYTATFAVLLLVGATLSIRNLRRGFFMLDHADRDNGWVSFVRRLSFGIVMVASTIVDLNFGPTYATYVIFGLIVTSRILRMNVKTSPSASWLRLRQPAPE